MYTFRSFVERFTAGGGFCFALLALQIRFSKGKTVLFNFKPVKKSPAGLESGPNLGGSSKMIQIRFSITGLERESVPGHRMVPEPRLYLIRSTTTGNLGREHRAWKTPRDSTHKFLRNFKPGAFPSPSHRFLHRGCPFCLPSPHQGCGIPHSGGGHKVIPDSEGAIG